MKKFILIFVSVLIAPVLFVAHSAHALELSPVFFDLVVKPGQSITQSIILKNDTESSMVLSYQVGVIETSSADGTTSKLLPKPTDMKSTADWITVSTPHVTLKAGETKKIPYTIDVPIDATPGGHYAWISWNEAPSIVTGAKVAISSGIATQVLLRVEGDVNESLTLQSFQAQNGMTSFEKLPITFVAHVFNEGNTHQRPVGSVVMKNMFGGTVATLPFNSDTQGGNILPKTGRSYDVVWDKGFAFGKYTAVLDATYSNGKHLTGQTNIWVLPKALLIVWTLILLIIIMLVARVLKRVSKRTPSTVSKKKV